MAFYVGMLKMTLRDWMSGAGNWLRSHGLSGRADYDREIDDEGLISQASDSAEPGAEGGEQGNNSVVVRSSGPGDRGQTLEKMQEGFVTLIEQLQGINEHLDRQVGQHAELMERIEKLPQWLESFPDVVENQKQITEQLLEQLKSAAAKQEQFVDAVEKIPNETAKQTDALVDIDHQLAASADTDVQMTESFNKFNQTLEKLNQTAESQTEGILTMSKTFATSDRYLKYVISKQNKRFMWVFVSAVSVCVVVILILTGIVIYLR